MRRKIKVSFLKQKISVKTVDISWMGKCKQVSVIFHTSFREKRLAKKYYDKLFKEYCITDLSRYKENKVQVQCIPLHTNKQKKGHI